jgi:hypothetical protein
MLLSNLKPNVATKRTELTMFTGNYKEQVAWRDAATGHIIAALDCFEPMTFGSLITTGFGGRAQLHRQGLHRAADYADARAGQGDLMALTPGIWGRTSIAGSATIRMLASAPPRSPVPPSARCSINILKSMIGHGSVATIKPIGRR